MVKNYLKRFSDWQNYVHYALLEIVMILALMHPSIEGAINITYVGLLWLYIAIFVGDSLIHLLFWFLPEPFQWRD